MPPLMAAAMGNEDCDGPGLLADECRRVAASLATDHPAHSLLVRCASALTKSADHVSAELESVARLIEKERTVWPEEIDRLNAIAARVRARIPASPKSS